MSKIEKICEVCSKSYLVPPYRKDKSRFCCAACRSSWVASNYLNKGNKPWASKNLEGHRHKSSSMFKKGHNPWNKDLKGIHLSPESEFMTGRDSEKSLPVGSITVRIHRGVSRKFIKIDEPNIWIPYARYVWIENFGTIPDRWVIHHKDRNTLNDEIENLQAMSREDHAREHYEELRESMFTVQPETQKPEQQSLL